MIDSPSPASTSPPQADVPPLGMLAKLQQSPWSVYALSAVLMLAILLTSLALRLGSADPPTIVLLTVPIILCAAAGGLSAGLAATVVAALLANYFLLPPVYSFSIASGLYSIQWLELIAAGVLISVLCEGLLRARRRAEASQQLQAITLASIGDAVITTDAQGRVTLLNSEAERLTGWRHQEALGQPSATVFRIADALTHAPLADPAERILRTGVAIQRADQVVLLRGDGAIPIDSSGALIVRADGAVAGVVLVFRDIRAQTQVEAAHLRLAAIVESSSDAIIGMDLYGIVTDWNAGATRIFGYAEREIAGRSISAIVPQDRRDEDPAILARIRRGERINHFETVRQRQDGSLVDVSVTVSPIRDPRGQIIGVSKVVRDIGDRTRAETALRESEERFRRVFMANPSPKLVTRVDNRQIVDANPAFARMIGYDLAELSGQTTDALGFWPDRAAVEEKRAQLGQAGLLTNSEMPIRTRDGSIRELLLSVVPVELDGVACFLTVMLDQTDRKRAEMALQRYAERLQHLHAIDQAILANDSAVAIAQATVGHIGQLIPSTRTALVLIDMAAQTMTLAALQLRGELQPSPNRSAPLALDADMLEQLQRGQVFHIADTAALASMPINLRTAQAEHLRAFFMAPILAGGELVATLNVGSDVPEVFSAEHIAIAREVADQLSIAIQQAQLRTQVERHAHELEQRVVARTAELEAANNELEAFSYSVSHDLRAPLRAIDGFARILLDEYLAALPQEAQRYFQLVRGSAQQMGHLIDDLLEFSRLSRQPLAKRVVDMNELVRQCLEDLRAEQADRAIDLQIGPLPACQGDPVLLKQVWINLLANALKYTRRRDQAVITIASQVTADERIYIVKDNGVGFDMRYSDKLFGVFQRLHRAEDYEGTGVGLAIVQRIVHRHGGQVWAEGVVGQGATFYFSIGGSPMP